MNQVILALVESPFLDNWRARIAFLTAKAEERKLKLYEMDLQWLAVKQRYKDLPQPSQVANERVVKDNRTAQQIVDDTLKGMMK